MLQKDQVRHFRITNKVYVELKVRAAKQSKPVGKIIEALVFPKK